MPCESDFLLSAMVSGVRAGRARSVVVGGWCPSGSVAALADACHGSCGRWQSIVVVDDGRVV